MTELSETKFEIILGNLETRELISSFTIVEQLNNQVNFHLGRGNWYAKRYDAKRNIDGSITFSIYVISKNNI